MHMQNQNRFSFTNAFLFLLLLALASCSTQDVKTAEDPLPNAVYAEPRIPGGGAGEKTGLDEADVDSEKATKPESTPEAVKETGIDQRVRSEIESLESAPIFFEFDKSDLGPDAQAVLKRLADWLKNNKNFSVLIEGHCDERGPTGYNLVLGLGRATAAEKYLQLLGIEAERISTLSYGEERPAMSGNSEEAWRRNRRGQFRLTANR